MHSTTPKPVLSRRTLLRSLPWLLVMAVSLSELALLDWALLVSGGPRLDAAASVGALSAMLAFHTAWTLLARRLRRSRSRMLGVEGLLVTLGLLASGGLVALVFVAVHAASLWVPELPKDRWILIGGCGALAAGLGTLIYSMTVGQARVSLERIDVRLASLHPALDGLRIAHISDLHIGARMRAPALRRFVDRVNACAPDLIVITGDIFDFDPTYIEEGCRELDKLWAPHGVFAILGNHDLYTGAEQVAHGLTRLTQLHLLRDAKLRLELRGAPLWMIGLEDGGEGMADRGIESAALEALVRELPRHEDRLLLVHRPNYLPQIARLELPLALAGHTHGGQVSLPRPVHHWNVARLTTPWTRGLFASGSTQIYVNRGLGVGGLSMRWNCSREIALLTLRRGAPDTSSRSA